MFSRNVSTLVLSFQYQNCGLLNINKLIFVRSSLAKILTTATTEKTTELTTCKSIDRSLILNYNICTLFLVLRKPIDTQ